MNPLLIGLTIPLLGTVIGAAFVFFIKDKLPEKTEKLLLGFASGVMIAASIWSLLIPGMNMNEHQGKFAVVPAIVGFLLGMAFLFLIDNLIPHQHPKEDEAEGPKSNISKTSKLVLAITIHNLPEGMAVGVVLVAAMQNPDFYATGVLATAVGIAIQNIPEGAIVSMPLKAAGNSRRRSFSIGALSGVVEPIGAALIVLLAGIFTPILPYLLAFAAGCMLYVVVEELIPQASIGKHSNLGTVGFAVGFSLMMMLDVILG